MVRLKLENRIRLYFVVMASLLGFLCFHHFLLIRFSACLKSHANMTFYSGVKYNLFYKGFDQTFFLKTFMNYFFGQGSMCQGYRATAIRHFTFDHWVSRSSWHSFDRARKDERLSRPWRHLLVMNPSPLDWESSALITRPVLHIL